MTDQPRRAVHQAPDASSETGDRQSTDQADSGARAAGGQPSSPGRKVLGGLVELVVVVVGALVISAILRAFIGQMFIIPSGSMENTLQVNDRVIVSKITNFDRGDVVVFEDPAGWILDRPAERSSLGKVGEKIGVLPATGTNHLVKRVMGMPGDHVKCCDDQGRITVNGQALDESSYLFVDGNGSQVKPSDWDFDVIVPADHVFVMGDHRNASGDSRIHLGDGDPKGANAFVPLDKVVGPAVAIAAPLDRIGGFGTPDTFAPVPAPSEPAPAEGKVLADGYGG
ncbi:signal peptidase I [Luteococcus sp.]|uniref:signal peptidase I n=1 Tax=Luteococcus sp. TaxID=1969402 RepID=UPI003735E9CE